MTQLIAGRTAEGEVLEALLADRSPEPRSVLVEGSPGIGKTTVLLGLLDRAREQGYAVAVCRPSPSEMDLSYAGLVSLLSGLDPATLESLPAPQARALRTILRLEEGADPVDRLSLSLATVAAVRSDAASRPLFLAVDDIQWLDLPSARMVAFLVRRLVGSDVRLVLVRTLDAVGPAAGGRTTGEPWVDWASELARAMPDGRHQTLRLGPLGPSDLARILRRVLGWAPAWPRVLRIAELSQGNPLHAIELTRAFGAARSSEGLEGSLPDSVLELARARIERLPRHVRDAVELASVPRDAPLHLLGQLEPGARDLRAALDDAARQGIVTVDEETVRFTHPILAAAAYDSIPAARRRDLHRALALLSDNLEERARHLAIAVERPDSQVAVALEGAAEQAWRRGAPDAAADLLRLACRVTPHEEGDALALRRTAYGRLLHSAGDAPGSVAELESVVADLPGGVLRAGALFHLMYVVRLSGALEHAVTLGVQAAEEAADDPTLEAEVWGLLSRISDNDIGRKLASARRAIDALARVAHPDPEVAFEVHAALVEAEFYAGLGVRLDRLEGLPHGGGVRFPPVRTAWHGDDLAGRLLAYDGRVEEGLALLRGMYERAAVENRSVLPTVLGWMAEAELSAGRFTSARELTQEALERVAEIGGVGGLPWELGLHAVATARLGRLEEAEATAHSVLDPGEAGLDGAPARLALGVVALSRAEPGEALRHLWLLDRLKREAGIAEPRLCAHVGDLVQALVEAGALDEATAVVDQLAEEALVSSGRWAAAVAARGEALVLGARGELDEALEAGERSLVLLAGLPAAFDRAQALLVVGQLRRRRRERALAREVMLEAMGTFEVLGAPVWVRRTREELARVPERRTNGALTATEERVARLAAEGLTNREIAERAFLSPKTVEVNLTRIYRKLGVRRTALAARLNDLPESAQP
ncbi:MAG: AAA family ATPase [Nocardioides sp.]